MSHRPLVLVLEAHARAAVEIIRSLLRHGVEVVAASDRRCCGGLFVRGLRHRVRCPSVDQPNAYVDWLLRYLATHKVDVLQPLGDAAVELVARNQDQIRRHARLFMPDYETFMIAFDKILTNKAAQRAGVPIPQSWYPDETGLDPVLKTAQFPLLVKPAVGVGARGIVRADGPAELERAWQAATLGGGRAFVQELLPLTGRQYVVDLLSNQDMQLLAAVASQKVRFYPVKGGASTLSRTVPGDELCDASWRLARSFGYFGVGNFDFIEDPRDGVAKFLEINPRFGEMHAICGLAGVDMPWMMFQLATGVSPAPVQGYKLDRFLRFMPTDLMWFLHSPDRRQANPGWWASFRQPVADTFVTEGDCWPLIGYIIENVSLLASPKKFLYRFRR